MLAWWSSWLGEARGDGVWSKEKGKRKKGNRKEKKKEKEKVGERERREKYLRGFRVLKPVFIAFRFFRKKFHF